MDTRRYYGLDALRGSMMMLGIVLHAAMFYLAAPPPTMPILADPNNSYAFDLIVHFIHSFRMPTFFVMAGFFASLLVEKRGIAGTWRNRTARVLGPLLAGTLTLVPITLILLLDFMLSVRFGTHDLLPDREHVRIYSRELLAAGIPVDQPPGPAHLWFLYYLCGFYLLIPVLEWVTRRLRPWSAGINRWMTAPAMLGMLGLLTAATLWPFRGGQALEGVVQLKPHPPLVIYYAVFFVFGYFVHGWRDFLRSAERLVPVTAVLAMLLFPLSLYLTHLETLQVAWAPMHRLLAVLAHGACTWALIYVCIGGALRYFDRASPWVLYLSNAAYWVFLAHLPVLALLAWSLLPFDLASGIKFLLIVAGTTAACLTSYHYWVQNTWIGVFLSGKRFASDWPWRVPSPPAEDGGGRLGGVPREEAAAQQV